MQPHAPRRSCGCTDCRWYFGDNSEQDNVRRMLRPQDREPMTLDDLKMFQGLRERD